MLKIINTACIYASTDKVWSALSELENVSLWAEPILEAFCTSENQSGVGVTRICKLKGGMTIREKWIEWEEGKQFTYIGEGMPMIKSAKNRWSVIDEGNNMTLLKSEAEIELKGGLVGRLLEIPMGVAMKRMGPQALSGFKYWVENGRPFEGQHSKLKAAPAFC